MEFTDAHYEKIKKVYSIWICLAPPKHRENTIVRYRICEENLIGETREKKENYDLLTAVMICLGGSEDEKYGGILKLLDVLLSEERRPEEKKRILKEEFDIAMTRELESEVEDMSHVLDRVAAREMEKGMKEGIIKGRKEGREEGVKEGLREGVLASVTNLMETMGWTAQQAMTALKIPAGEQDFYASMIKK